MLTDLEKSIIRELQEDLPLAARPFQMLAERIGLTEAALLDKIREMQDKGIIRRVGVVLRHQQAGIAANAMVVWQVPTARVEEVGMVMAAFPTVSHCYVRPTFPDWPYNLFTMVHGRDRAECERIAGEIAQAAGISDYRLLFSTIELKKTSMRYFVEKG